MFDFQWQCPACGEGDSICPAYHYHACHEHRQLRGDEVACHHCGCIDREDHFAVTEHPDLDQFDVTDSW